MNKRFSREQLAHQKIVKWFDSALKRDALRPSDDAYHRLADQLKVLINRADNNELRKVGTVCRRHLKDLSPEEERQKKIDALVKAAKELEDSGIVQLPTRKGDILLSELIRNLRLILGSHRLVCGDATSPGSFLKMLGDERAEMVVTDPPYNVKIQGHARGRSKKKHREFAMASGEMTSFAFRGFLGDWTDDAPITCKPRKARLYSLCVRI